MINTIDGQKLRTYVNKVIEERKKKIYESDKSKIKILPKFKEAIERSKQVSSKVALPFDLLYSRERPSRPPPQAHLEEAEKEARDRRREAGVREEEVEAGAI